MSLNISVRVKEIQQITPVIREFSFEAVDHPLLPFSSGSHIVVQLPLPDRVLRNAYSLLNDPYDQHEYKIAVRLQEQSRGGSRYLHEQVKVGDQLSISAPLNLFRFTRRHSIMSLLPEALVLLHSCHICVLCCMRVTVLNCTMPAVTVSVMPMKQT